MRRLTAPLMLMTATLAACAPLATSAPIFTAAPSIPTATQPPTATLPPTVTPQPAPVLKPLHEIDPALPIHDVILFSTSRLFPLLIADEGPRPSVWPEHQLWVVSPDGTRSGSIANRSASPNVAWHFRGNPLERLFVVATYPIGFQDERIKVLALEDCQASAGSPPCAQFTFSSDGSWLAYNAFEDVCGRALLIVSVGDDAQVGTPQLLASQGTHGFGFLASGQLLASIGHCQGGWVHLFDPVTGENLRLGAEGDSFFGAGGASLVVQTYPHMGWGAEIWGYNFEDKTNFAAYEGESDRLVLTPDGQTALYQYRSLRIDRQTFDYFLSARVIASLDTVGGDSRTLLSDPEIDYHLCSAWNAPCEWRGDWVQARRIAFRFADHPFSIGSLGSDSAEWCVRYGHECLDSAELVGIHWQTGEVRPWAEIPASSPAPTAIPTPTLAPGPDTSRSPVYADPSGDFAFYVGRDGKSLWMVPASGEPVLWVIDGENFVYIP